MVFHAAYDVVLQPIRKMAEKGESIKDPQGTPRWVVPIVLSVVGDNPELSMVAGTFNHHEATCKCQRCLRLSSQMGLMWEEPATWVDC